MTMTSALNLSFFIPTQTMPFCFKNFRLLCRAEEFKFHGVASMG